MNYAGFWRRFGAAVVDGIVVNVAIIALGYVLEAVGLPFFESIEYVAETAELSASASAAYDLTPFGAVVALVSWWLYAAVLESAPRGATLGKMALGLRVTDLDGNRIGFLRATGRFFGKFLSGLILMIGFVMAGFTKRKQALHDMLAGGLVLAKAA
ncbi:MAG: RDD family protein [Alphaproteobacteria bacterium]|nr:RDD family protein [Alphaproteobacteria bacterium]